MNSGFAQRWKLPTYGRFFLAVLLTVAVATVLAWAATGLFQVPEGTLRASLVAFAIAGIASLLGALPVWVSRRAGRPAGLGVLLGPLTLRVAVVVLLGISVVQRGWVAQQPFVFALAACYVLLLIPDTLYATSSEESL